MNEFEKRKCVELTTKMWNKDLCRPFRDKVDPERDGAPGYFNIIKRPMDLGTIKKKLNANEYKSIEQWAEDVNLVWSNAKLYNNEGTLINLIAQELEQWFSKKLRKLPRNKDEEWMINLQKSSKTLTRLSQHPPASIVPKYVLLLDPPAEPVHTTAPQTVEAIPRTESSDLAVNIPEVKSEEPQVIEVTDTPDKIPIITPEQPQNTDASDNLNEPLQTTDDLPDL